MVNGLSPAKEPLAAPAGRLSSAVSQQKAAAAAAATTNCGGTASETHHGLIAAGEPAPLNFSLPHGSSLSGSSGPVEEQPKQKKAAAEETHRAVASGGLYRPYSTSPTPPRTLPGTSTLNYLPTY